MDVQQNHEEQKALVREFRLLSGQPVDVVRANALVAEEAEELLSATEALMNERTVENMEAFIKEAADLLYVITGAVEQAQAIGIEKAVEEMGKHPDLTVKVGLLVTLTESVISDSYDVFLTDEIVVEAFNRIHASNMSKVGPSGKVEFRDDGKVLKGPNYAPPVLTDLAEQALRNWSAFSGANDMLRELMEAIG